VCDFNFSGLTLHLRPKKKTNRTNIDERINIIILMNKINLIIYFKIVDFFGKYAGLENGANFMKKTFLILINWM
jgi:hypothetical protein